MFKQIELYHQNSKRYVHDVDIISTNQIAQLVELMTYLGSLIWFMTYCVYLEDLLTHSKKDYDLF
jgi:hypothetical protein